jgi:hypothetical protein
MNHLMWPVSLVGILSTAVVCGTDMFFLTVGRPALRLASPSAGTEVMGFVHMFGDARTLYADPVRRYLQSLVKADQSASNRSGNNGRTAQ